MPAPSMKNFANGGPKITPPKNPHDLVVMVSANSSGPIFPRPNWDMFHKVSIPNRMIATANAFL